MQHYHFIIIFSLLFLFGCAGVVVGALLESGDIDTEKALAMRLAASGISITFHRAFDICRNPEQALASLISLKYDRLLTSGRQASALKGMLALGDIVLSCGDKLVVVAAAGITAENASIIIAGTGVSGIHAGTSVMSVNRNSKVESSDSNITMGVNNNSKNNDVDDMAWMKVDVKKTRRYVESANTGFDIIRKTDNNNLAKKIVLSRMV